MKLSKRGLNIQASPIRKLYPLANQTEKKGREVIKLNIGQPDIELPKIVRQEIKNYKREVICYAPSQGLPQVIKAWQKYLIDSGLDFKNDEIVVTTGGSEAIIFAMAAIADAGEEIIVFEPFYTNYNGFASLIDVKLNPITLKIEKGFHLPPREEIEKRINKKTKGIIITNPNNPTGTVYTKEELNILALLAEKYDLFIINDEVYREFVFGDSKFYSLFNFKNIKKNIILADSVSKRFNACGARLGCLASYNKKIIENVTKFAQARLSSPTIEQEIFIPLLKNSKEYINNLILEYKKRRETVKEELKKIPNLTYRFPEGSFYIIIGLPVDNSEKFCQWLLTNFEYKNKTLLLAPACGFYASPDQGKNEVRLAFVYQAKILKEAMQILKIALKKYKNEK
ncbi:MAG: pyridoxal phosphate-dependent aminotransferase [Patescibacteria group bacterium]|nr:pyridoxal phosphate-dependent aminotransferase [Patescibacteria group bacterium]